ncbi:MAG: biopolymer transporter ExbD [Bacteroidia bacterium]|nr:biopolymer transporter ExbD [Bacteroidia bacterium]
MASIENNTGGRKGRQRRSVRVDMTAMVDVAFLLLTFFILTTTLANPKMMEIATPKNSPVDLACSKVMTIFPGQDGMFHHFTGCDPESVQTSTLNEVRARIYQNIATVNDLIISIKPTENSKYATVVNILDEMEITGAKKYALSEITEQDIEFLDKKGLK